MKKYRVVSYIFLIIFIIIMIFVCTKDNLLIDEVGHNIVTSIRNKSLTDFFKFITWFGSGLCLVILSILFLLRKKSNISILCNLILVSITNRLIKLIIHRPRPSYALVSETGFSFPSGHAMISCTFYSFLIYLVYKNVKNTFLKWVIIIILSILILLIDFSRIYLGVHYTTDVLAGFVLSISYLYFFIKYIYQKYFNF